MALAYHQLGRPDEAGKWLARAKAWAERPEGRGTALLGWDEEFDARQLYREVEGLLKNVSGAGP